VVIGRTHKPREQLEKKCIDPAAKTFIGAPKSVTSRLSDPAFSYSTCSSHLLAYSRMSVELS
jgi:hypothetical protein